MKTARNILLTAMIGLLGATGQAALLVKLDEPKPAGSKTVVKITMKNTFKENVESARATLFLIDDNGKVVGQNTGWVIGGARKKQPPLAADASTTFSFVVSPPKPFVRTRLAFSRITLLDSRPADPP